jgi:uncharacterized membrane protein YphA (DoxX/SURF4 family)
MQRLFPMFPAAAPGCALVLLRVSAALSLHLGGSGHLVVDRPLYMVAALACFSLTLLLGVATPFVSLAAVAIQCAMLVMTKDDLAAAAFLLPVSALALALLGPGAYSLDARLFGRRVLIVPQRRQ